MKSFYTGVIIRTAFITERIGHAKFLIFSLKLRLNISSWNLVGKSLPCQDVEFNRFLELVSLNHIEESLFKMFHDPQLVLCSEKDIFFHNDQLDLSSIIKH